MKVYHYRVGTGRIRAIRRLGTHKPARIRRLWAPYKHRELVLSLIGLVIVFLCVAPLPVGYWLRMQAERDFQIRADKGKLSLFAEQMTDRGQSILKSNTAYDYGDPFPTSGPYDSDWVNPGFYDSPRAPTLLVHTLERGMVVIYYDVPQPIVLQTLKGWADLFHGDKDGIVVVVHPGLRNKLVLTAWDRRLKLAEFDPDVAAAFIDAYRGRGPEKPAR